MAIEILMPALSPTMEEGTFSSAVFSGTSIDNIAPSVPENRVATLNGANLNLSWSPSVANDFSHYSICLKAH